MIERFDAYLFDLDGVITPTVLLHRRAWRETFDRVFAARGAEPYRDSDYFEWLDGRPRFEGVAALLAARSIELPAGEPGATAAGDPGDAAAGDTGGAAALATIHGIGDAKNRLFGELLAREGIEPYPGTVALVERLTALGRPLAVVSSSRNAESVLRAAGLRDRFAAVVDGVVAADEGLRGKPAPDTFLRAAEMLGAGPGRSVVFEDAASGVAAGRAGGFGLVVGVDRGAGRAALETAGAHTVVADLGQLA